MSTASPQHPAQHPDLDPQLRHWAEAVLGGTITGIHRVFGGGSRETSFVTLDHPDGRTSVAVLRVESGGGAFSGTEISLAREATAYRALQDSGVPVPRVYGVTADGSALLMAKVSGEAVWQRIPAAEHQPVAMDFARQLAALHCLDPRRLDLPGFSYPETPADHALQDLLRWHRLYLEHTANDDPLASYAFAWLRSHAPATVTRTTLVQGDTGVGNFLAAGGRVTGLVDWEFSYIGDPHNDIAFVDMRHRSNGSAAAFSGWLEEYQRAGGIAVDPSTLLYYRALVELRCVVTTAMSIHRGGGALGLAGYLATRESFRHHLARWLGEANQVDAQPVAIPPPRAQAASALFGRALSDLDTLVRPTLKEPAAKVGANAVRIFLEHLRLRDLFGDHLAEQEREDRIATFGGALPDASVIQAAEAAGASGDKAVLGYLLRSVARDGLLWDFSLVAGRGK